MLLRTDPHQSSVQSSGFDHFLKQCTDNNIALNVEKCQFFKTEITLAGFQPSSSGYKVDSFITETTIEYLTPTSRYDLQYILHGSASLLTPFRPLLSTKNYFPLPRSILKNQNITYYITTADMTKPTRFSADASRQGLGFVLQQPTVSQWTLWVTAIL